MIETQDLEHRIASAEGDLHILRGINLRIEAGETVAIIGASGSGKSTLLGMLAGLDTPTSGKVLLDEQEITAMDEEQRAALRMQKVGFVFQNFQLLTSLTALENVLLPLELQNRAGADKTARQYLQRVGLAARETHYPQQLSGGEQQRVAIARAFACQASILFADEPTGNLDRATGEIIANLLFELNQDSRTTLVLVTHDPVLASRCARQLHLVDGQIQERAA